MNDLKFATEIDFPTAVWTAIIVADVVIAVFVFFVLRQNRHPLAFVLPPLIILTGVIVAKITFYVLSQSAH